MKDFQARGEAFSSQKRTSSTSKDEIYYLTVLYFSGPFFALLDPDTIRLRIRIHNTAPKNKL
jgi:hypothetical protein